MSAPAPRAARIYCNLPKAVRSEPQASGVEKVASEHAKTRSAEGRTASGSLSRVVADTGTRTSRRALLAICAVAAVLRLAHLREIAANDPFYTLPEVDGRLYDAWARRILEGLPLDDGVLFLGPLYAYFMALVYALLDATPAAVKVVQCGLGVVVVALVAVVAREVFDRRVALLAASIAALYEMLIFYGGTLMVVNVQVPLVLLVVWLSLRALRRPTALRWLAAGLVCGLSALARQTALLFAPLVVGWLLVSQRGRLPGRALAGCAAAFVLALALPILPFTLQNYRASGDFVLLNSTGGANLYMGNNAYSDGTWLPPRIGRRIDHPVAMRDAFTRTARERTGRELRPSEVSAYWAGEALAFVVEHPAHWLALELRKLLLFVNAREVWNVRAIEVERDFSWVLRLPLLRYGVVAPFGLLGLGLAARRWRELLPLYAMLAAYLAAALIFFVLARYRMPSVPLLFVFAAFTAVWLFDAARARAWRRLAGSLAALIVLAGVVHLPLGEGSLHMAHFNLGNKYMALSRWDEAIASFGRAIAIRPSFLSSYNNLALTFEGARRREDAITTWQWVLARALEQGDEVRAARARRHLRALGVEPEPPPGS